MFRRLAAALGTAIILATAARAAAGAGSAIA